MPSATIGFQTAGLGRLVSGGGDTVILIAIIVAALAILAMVFLLGGMLNLYIMAVLANARVSMRELIGMRLRRVDIRTVLFSRIRAVKSGLDVSTTRLETHALSGGRVSLVVSAMIAARHAGFDLPWRVATALDLAGHDPLAGVNELIDGNPSTDQGREAARLLASFLREAGVDTKRLRLPDGESAAELAPLVGAVGEVVEPLAPAGRVRIGSRTYIARGRGSGLSTGAIIRVAGVGDGGLVVERAV